jgi:hypothetical protein
VASTRIRVIGDVVIAEAPPSRWQVVAAQGHDPCAAAHRATPPEPVKNKVSRPLAPYLCQKGHQTVGWLISL